MQYLARQLILIAAVTYAAFVLQSSLVPLVFPNAWAPNLIVAGLVWMVWRSSGRTAIVVAAGWGLIADGLSPGGLGINVVGFVAAAWLIQLACCRLPRLPVVLLSALLALTALVVPTVTAVIGLALAREVVDIRSLLMQGTGSAVSTGLLAMGLLLAWRMVFDPQANSDDRQTVAVSNRWSMLTE
ncbi:MAG: hypothetical protein EXS05_09975 [Planctomycetaceae bacterium]|nr:hypothetical protein [Planctomycetaceae bacterium]